MLVAHNSEPVGWHKGKVRAFGAGAKGKKVCEMANFIVTYTKKDTSNALCGAEGFELSKSEWWLLFEPVAAAEE